MTPIAILILAAGASSRMAPRDKLLEQIDGVALLERQTMRAMATGCPVWVALPAKASPRDGLISTATRVPVPNAHLGMSESLKTGVRAIPIDHAILILPADMPDIATTDMICLINAFQSDPHANIHRATTSNGHPGHPVLFAPQDRDALLQTTQDIGARHVLLANKHRITHVQLPGDNALIDLDTPAAWDAYLANRAPDS